MLQNLIESRDNALENYSTSESVKNLGLYNKSVNNLKKYITDNNIADNNIIDTLRDEYNSLSRMVSRGTFDLTGVDDYNTDFEVD